MYMYIHGLICILLLSLTNIFQSFPFQYMEANLFFQLCEFIMNMYYSLSVFL